MTTPTDTDKLALFTRDEVFEAWGCLRRYNHSIPDECLDQMRAVLLDAIAHEYRAQPANAVYSGDELNAIASRLDPSGATADLIAIQQARQALRHLARQAQPASVDGWVMVPREPTFDMMNALGVCICRHYPNNLYGLAVCREALQDAFAAAPQPAKESE